MICNSSERNSFIKKTEHPFLYIDVFKRKLMFFCLILIDEDPDNTVSIMLDGVESRLHIITIDIDQVN